MSEHSRFRFVYSWNIHHLFRWIGAIWPSLSPCTVIKPILLTYCSDDHVTEIASNKKQQWHRVKNGSHLILWLMTLPLLCVYLKWSLMSKHPRTRFRDLKWQFSHIHVQNKKHSRSGQQFETFSRRFLGGTSRFDTGKPSISRITETLSPKTPRLRFPHAELRNALFMLGAVYWFY